MPRRFWIPYSGPDDPSLPEDIKKLPANKRRQFVAVWGSAYQNCRDKNKGGGAGNAADCEGIAFRFARSAVKEMTMEEEDSKEGRMISTVNLKKIRDALTALNELLSAAEPSTTAENKDFAELPCPSVVQEHPKRFDGATTWSGLDAWGKTADISGQASNLWWNYDGLVQNIRMNEKMSDAQKATAMMAALQELSVRMGDVRPKEKGLLEKVKDFFDPGSKSESAEEEELETGSKPYPNEHAARVRDPGDFEPNSFRSMELPKSGGVRIILGRLKGETTTTTQAYRFPVDSFTSEEAKTWLKDHDVKGASFEPAKKAEKDIVGSFKVSKDANDRWRWLSLTTNKFKDREGEIFSEEAHKEYVEYVNAFHSFPELWLWHTPGSRIGVADFADYVDGFVLHSGTFDEGKESVAASLAAAKDLAVSHGYKYRPADKEDGVYEWYRTFEVSALPAERAANAWTDILSKKEVVMSFSEAKKAFLIKHLGEEDANDIESRVAALSKQLEEAGVAFKDLVEDTLPTPEAKADNTSVPAADNTSVPAADNTSVPAADNTSAQLQDISSKIEAIGSQVEEVKAEVAGFKGELDLLKRTDAQKIDDAVAPRRPAPDASKGPANSEETLVDAEKQAALEEAAKKEAAGGKDPYIGPYVDDLLGGRLVGGGVVTSGE